LPRASSTADDQSGNGGARVSGSSLIVAANALLLKRANVEGLK